MDDGLGDEGFRVREDARALHGAMRHQEDVFGDGDAVLAGLNGGRRVMERRDLRCRSRGRMVRGHGRGPCGLNQGLLDTQATIPSASGSDSKIRSGYGGLAQTTVELGSTDDVMTPPFITWVGSHPGV